MRFIHAADIHLDSPLDGLSVYAGDSAGADDTIRRLRLASREAFTALVSSAIELAVDFMVIAGDLYDGDWRDFNTGIFFVAQMGRLNAAGIPVFLLFGNHDADSEMTRKLVLPPNVRIFSSEAAQTHRLDELKVALHGRSFRVANTTENLVLGYPAAEPGWLNIGVLHTAMEGDAAHARYAPCTMADLAARGYQYWALGHVHEYRIWQGPPVVAYPGNLQGRHARETGARGALLVTAQNDRIVNTERLLVDVARWMVLEVDASAAADVDAVVVQAGGAMQALLAAAGHRLPMMLRVRVQGRCAAHGDLFRLEERLRADLVAQAMAIDPQRLWIEKVVLTEPAHSPQDLAARSDALADLQQVLGEVDVDAAFKGRLAEELKRAVTALPAQAFADHPELSEIRDGRIDTLLARTLPALLAQLARKA
ncbi:MAG: DNA repair exonuclease [Burkholderiaceae bacterium]